MQFVSSKDLLNNRDVAIFRYNLNQRAVKMFEFGAIFLVLVAALIYPMTHFEPREWMAAPVAIAIAAVAAFYTAQKWRRFVVTEFLGWDENHFYVSKGRKAAAIPWDVLTVDNTGLKDPDSGAVLNIRIDDDPAIQLRLVSGFIIVEQFQLVLKTILTHIKENQDREKAAKNADKPAKDTDESKAAANEPAEDADESA